MRDQARRAGLGPIRAVSSASYLVLGDASAPFLEAARSLCEGLAGDYLARFRALGFAVARPEARMAVVALSGPAAFAAFLGVPQDRAVGGQYDMATNRLVMFDNRAREGANPRVERANTVALMHEATHQLTFNTGLLDRRSDVPLAVSEGLAMVEEVRRPDGHTTVGARNDDRIPIFVQALRQKRDWIPLARLLAENDPFEAEATQQLAYAEAWLLVHELLASPELLPRFRQYLDRIRTRRDATHRVEDARACLGDLDRLDRDLGRTATRLARPFQR